MNRDVDAMPRPLILTMLVGCMVGAGMWAGLIALVAR